MESALDHGRQAYAGRAWAQAYRELSQADGLAPLDIDDLERLATAAHLAGEGTATQAWQRAYRACLRRDLPARAARCAFWLAHSLLDRGELALGSGWLARAAEAVGDVDCVEHGYLLI
ncbi:MAG TPA: LuxR family transcriptional regulator, partial [Micromonosporaceae bacterium]